MRKWRVQFSIHSSNNIDFAYWLFSTYNNSFLFCVIIDNLSVHQSHVNLSKSAANVTESLLIEFESFRFISSLVYYHFACNILFITVYFVFSADSVTMTTSKPLSLLGSAVPGLQSMLSSLPSAPSNLEAVITSTRFITLAWEQPSANADSITGYSIFYQQEGSER